MLTLTSEQGFCLIVISLRGMTCHSRVGGNLLFKSCKVISARRPESQLLEQPVTPASVPGSPFSTIFFLAQSPRQCGRGGAYCRGLANGLSRL